MHLWSARQRLQQSAPKAACPRRIRRGAKLEAMSHRKRHFSVPSAPRTFTHCSGVAPVHHHQILLPTGTAEPVHLHYCVDTIAFLAYSAVTSITPRPSFNVDSRSLFSNGQRHLFALFLNLPNDVLTAPSEPIPHPLRTASRARVVVHRSVMAAHSSFTSLPEHSTPTPDSSNHRLYHEN